MNCDTKNMTILVVDDTPENISIIGEYLSPYQVKVATSGPKALQIAESTNLDLILLDIKMPDMDGYQVCRLLKENPKTKDIPIIFLTVLSETMDKVNGFNLGAVDYITKPFQIDEVKSRIETHLTLSAYRKRLQNINQELERIVEERTRELLFVKNKAEEASRLKSYFLALMNHELRTPLAGILGFSEILIDEVEDKSHKDCAIAVKQAAVRLKDTFESIINLANFYSHRQTINFVPINLNKRIENLIESNRLNAEIKKLEMILHNDVEINTALDWAVFDVIFNNVLGNAIKYTEKGKIEIRLAQEERGNILYDSITVTDTGIGIPIEIQSTIFEEFRQGDEGMSRNFQGMGLGLSLVKKFIDLHDGIIELVSSPGKGSSFRIMLPHIFNIASKEYNNIQSEIVVNPCAGDKKTLRILFIEKDPIEVEIEKLFHRKITEPDIAVDGFKAIDQAKKNKYDAVVINLNLGLGIPGIEVIKEIKKIEGYNNIPVVSFTTNITSEELMSSLKKDDLQYLPEPDSSQEIFKRLSEFC